MKYLIIPLILFPITTFAWTAPKLESICGNYINITLAAEPNYIIEFSGTETFDDVIKVDFVHAGSHAMHMPISGTLYARFVSDKKAGTSVKVKDCTPPKEEKKKSNRRKKKHGYIRRPVVQTMSLPLFDYPLSDIKG